MFFVLWTWTEPQEVFFKKDVLCLLRRPYEFLSTSDLFSASYSQEPKYYRLHFSVKNRCNPVSHFWSSRCVQKSSGIIERVWNYKGGYWRKSDFFQRNILTVGHEQQKTVWVSLTALSCSLWSPCRAKQDTRYCSKAAVYVINWWNKYNFLKLLQTSFRNLNGPDFQNVHT